MLWQSTGAYQHPTSQVTTRLSVVSISATRKETCWRVLVEVGFGGLETRSRVPCRPPGSAWTRRSVLGLTDVKVWESWIRNQLPAPSCRGHLAGFAPAHY